jgi:hypothetical protein
VAAGVRSALRRAPQDAFKADDLAKVKDFVSNPTEFLAQHPASFSGAQMSQNPFGDYAPASTAIQGTLKNMYDEFASKLEAANADEAQKQKTFEALSATKAQELATLQATLENKQTTLGETSKNLAESNEERSITTKQLKDDEKFFEEMKEACKTRADQWAERSRLRTEELAGVAKAIEILGSDEAGDIFSRASTSLLQTASEIEDPGQKAYKSLKDVAK